MPDPDIDNELDGMRRELRSLEVAIVRQGPPLDNYTKAIAEAKIRKLQRQIKTLEEKSASV
jgi:hypothetical protein